MKNKYFDMVVKRKRDFKKREKHNIEVYRKLLLSRLKHN